jgi:hypothetical protein
VSLPSPGARRALTRRLKEERRGGPSRPHDALMDALDRDAASSFMAWGRRSGVAAEGWLVNDTAGSWLALAIKRDAFECARALLGSGECDPDFMTAAGICALGVAASMKRDRRWADMLLERCDPSIELKPLGDRVLHQAAWNGADELLEALLPRVDLNARSSDGSSALMFAVRRGNLGCVRILASCPGANLWGRDAKGKTALNWASRFAGGEPQDSERVAALRLLAQARDASLAPEAEAALRLEAFRDALAAPWWSSADAIGSLLPPGEIRGALLSCSKADALEHLPLTAERLARFEEADDLLHLVGGSAPSAVAPRLNFGGDEKNGAKSRRL